MPKLLFGRPDVRSAAATPGGIAGAAVAPAAPSSSAVAKAAAARIDRNVVMGVEPTGSTLGPWPPVPMSDRDGCRTWVRIHQPMRPMCSTFGRVGATRDAAASAGLSERQVDAVAPEQRVDAVLSASTPW